MLHEVFTPPELRVPAVPLCQLVVASEEEPLSLNIKKDEISQGEWDRAATSCCLVSQVEQTGASC